MQGAMTIDGDSFESRDRITGAERAIFGVAGLFCLFPAWDFFIRPGIPPFQLVLLPFWAIAIGAASIGLPLVAAALLGGDRLIRLDRASQTGSVHTRSALFSRRRSFRFTDIGTIEAVVEPASEGPDTYALLLTLKDSRKPLKLRSFAEKAPAEATAETLRHWLR